MSEIDYIKAEALGIEEGATQAVYCPFCDNEKPYSPSLSITRNEDGIVYNCYRAVCSGRGFLGSMPYGGAEKAVEKAKTNPWTGETQTLRDSDVRALKGKYLLDHSSVKRFTLSGGRLIMPIYNDKGEIWGYNSKQWMFARGVKSVNYTNFPYEAGIHWATFNRFSPDVVVIVEDILSATRVQQDINSVHSVALLGTVFNDTTVKSLMKRGIKHVVIALDPDALGKAVFIVRKYRVFFNTMRLLSLSKDPKDLTASEFSYEIKSNI